MKRILLLLFLLALPASAAWTLSTEGVPFGCTHVITDGNWQIGVYRYADDNWSLGKAIGNNGSPYLAGSGDLDLRSLDEQADDPLPAAKPSSSFRFGNYMPFTKDPEYRKQGESK